VPDILLNDSEEKDPIIELCVVYVLYFDELKGHVPILAYPNDDLKHDKEYMRPIEFHTIWFLDIEDDEVLDHVDLEYRGFTYFGKKFLTKSKRIKRRAGFKEETPETIVIIISLPQEIDIFGDKLIKILTKEIKSKFDDQFFLIIQSEIEKDHQIKTPVIEELIEKGSKIKRKLRVLIDRIVQDFLSNELKKTLNTNSLEKQEAVSFLSLKGIESSIFNDNEGKSAISDIHSFDPSKKNKNKPAIKPPFIISNTNVLVGSKELEIIVQNKTNVDKNSIHVIISHVQELLEKEILDIMIETWYSEEQLVFTLPLIPDINEYYIYVLDKDYREDFLSKKINLNLLAKKSESKQKI
jgi:hypothetical protein